MKGNLSPLETYFSTGLKKMEVRKRTALLFVCLLVFFCRCLRRLPHPISVHDGIVPREFLWSPRTAELRGTPPEFARMPRSPSAPLTVSFLGEGSQFHFPLGFWREAPQRWECWHVGPGAYLKAIAMARTPPILGDLR